MRWSDHKASWPNHAHSRFIRTPPHDWHVQHFGTGTKPILFLHGTGASTHSWAGLIPYFQDDFDIVAVDLPGHGFTALGSKQRSSLTLMGEDIVALCREMSITPELIIGHSAGAALALEISKALKPRAVFGLNAATKTFSGLASWAFPFAAKMIALNPFIPSFVAGLGRNERRVKSLIENTGSKLTSAQLAFYETLFQNQKHVEGALLMMAQWNLDHLLYRLHEITTPVYFISAENDKTISPVVSIETAAVLPNGTAYVLDHLGHLAHEEDPKLVAETILQVMPI